MKKELIPSIIITLLCIVLFSGIYPAVIWGIAQLTPDKGEGHKIAGVAGKVYYSDIGQRFTDDKYFWPRPSAVDYNAAGSGGSNKSPDNGAYLVVIQSRIDTFMAHNPSVRKQDIPSDLVTASGSGLDPDISTQAAEVQVMRIASARHLEADRVRSLVRSQTKNKKNWLGPESVNVLQLNIELDKL